ncbi:HAD-IIB family hydrolase [Thiohalomonas denitrificans]|uniref:sucrose-phosphate synthase n=1 Tax=Thiohalomonas denitrificans TaxID=415747 RepID=A0A1G5PKH4_9GAMM|nr:HAD-IIB family hydrolase [Thiohalomonas denitrificans]SCZ49630.1 sucrose-phosphate synthase [Thiohalomonas denitrificans]
MNNQGLYIALISVHGLIRGHNLELGRDADTGGQTTYVVELARALASHPEVARVDLLTRRVIDPKVSPDYAIPLEPIAPNANIVRLAYGPRRYLRKEVLWPYLDSMADQALQHIRETGRVPDIIHSHYADAGYVGTRLAGLLGVPLIHTGHSLGREKRRRLLDRNLEPRQIEKHYNISERIDAEEMAMDVADRVIASTRQEVEEQYSLYDNYHPRRMRVIPPGTELSRFHPPTGTEGNSRVKGMIERFLTNPEKPLILALSRADERKNIQTLVRAYGENKQLRDTANLLVIAGNRDDIGSMERGPRKVLTDLLLLIDRYDLYGQVAYPKHHHADDVPDFYRLAAESHGVFVNPALTEPFGLTLIEAAASGLPVVATRDGGPRDIVGHCKNGLLVDPLDSDRMGEALLEAVSNRKQWECWSDNGIKGAHRYYSWHSHVEHYVQEVGIVLDKHDKARPVQLRTSRLPTIERLVVCDLNDTLLGDPTSLRDLLEALEEAGDRVGFGVVSGQHLESTLAVLDEWGVQRPDLVVTLMGSEVYYGNRMVEDHGWRKHIDYRWDPEGLRQAMGDIPGVRLQAADRDHKIDYFIDPDTAPPVRKIIRYLRNLDLHANVVYSHERFLDLLPIRASKGLALRYVAAKWGISPQHILAAGDSGNDIEMLRGDILGVVVGNHSHELERLRGEPGIYFAEAHHAAGVLEGLHHYAFLEARQPPVTLEEDE